MFGVRRAHPCAVVRSFAACRLWASACVKQAVELAGSPAGRACVQGGFPACPRLPQPCGAPGRSCRRCCRRAGCGRRGQDACASCARACALVLVLVGRRLCLWPAGRHLPLPVLRRLALRSQDWYARWYGRTPQHQRDSQGRHPPQREEPQDCCPGKRTGSDDHQPLPRRRQDRHCPCPAETR